MDKLKPCPFCGGEDIAVRTKFIQEKGDFAETIEAYCGCKSCGMGAIEENEEDAIEAWNTRKGG
jgi:Lar family restriction alleviation protein